jgi:hypothetical protein
LAKFLQLPRKLFTGTKHTTPVFILDSKGIYLKNQIQYQEEHSSIWWCKKGATIEERLHSLRSNIESKINEIGNIHLYIWLGTCNLTQKGKHFSNSLANPQPEPANEIIESLQIFEIILKPYPGTKLTILEVPHYSIVQWNTSRTHPKPEIFKDQDEQLQNQIDQVNTFIQQYNTTLQSRSPLFNHHLKARKEVRRGKGKPHKNYYNLYTDGIHPKLILAKA